MRLVAGEMELHVITAIGEPARHNDTVVDSVRLILPDDITEDQILALTENPWNLYSDDGTFIQTHSGYNHVAEYSIKFYKVPAEAKLIEELARAASEISEARAYADQKVKEAQSVQDQLDSLKAALSSAGLNPDDILQKTKEEPNNGI